MQNAIQGLKRSVSIEAAIIGGLYKVPIYTTPFALAAVMYMTRRIDWYAQSRSAADD